MAGAPTSPDARRALARVRLRHLQCFVAIAELGSLRQAAEALAVTQPAVTRTLSELEDLLGTALVVRGRRGAVLTPAGEAFLVHAGASVGALTQAVDSVVQGPAQTTLRLGVLPTLAAFCADVLQTLRGGEPAPATVSVASGRNADLIGLLRARELDAVIGRLAEPEPMHGLLFEPLYAEPMLIVLSPRHPLAGKRTAAPAEIGAQPLVLPLPGTMIRQVADSHLASRGIVPAAGIVETLDTGLARALALQGPHLWFAPAGAVQGDLAAERLRRLPLLLTPEEPVGLITRNDLAPTAVSEALRAAVRRAAATRRQEAEKLNLR